MRNVLIIFGATGDLMDKKISPALFGLNQDKPESFQKAIGYGRRELTNETFREMVKASINKKMHAEENVINEFLNKVEYHQGEFHDVEAYKSLNQKLISEDPETIKHVYLAIPPELYQLVIENMASASFLDQSTKLMVEKPIGHDLKSSQETEELFAKHFSESQIYRIDHYLGKDSVQNVISFRFANSMFDPVWSNKYIDKIEIRANETLGVENRGSFYDSLGALRDFGQNHLLQLLALVTMDEPEVLCCDNIRQARAKLLSMLKPLTDNELISNTFRAQYSSYKTIENVKPDSQVETYFKIKCFVDSERWKGVPFYLEHGKRMGKINKEIVVHFKGINKVIFSLEPEDSIKIFVQTKKPGITFENEDNMITLKMKEIDTSIQYVAEYTELLHDFLTGDQTFFVSKDESMYMWQFVQPILDAWSANKVPLETYMPDSNEAEVKANVKI